MFTICFDTIYTGFTPVTDENNEPVQYNTKQEAQKEIDNDQEFYDDCFTCEISEIGHKTIYTGEIS